MRMYNPIAELIEACFIWLSVLFLWIIMVVAVSAVLAVLVMLLWNWLMPIMFGLKTLTFLQSWGLTILCNILFKNANIKKKTKACD